MHANEERMRGYAGALGDPRRTPRYEEHATHLRLTMNYSAFRIVMVREDASDVHVSAHLSEDPLDRWGAQPDPGKDRVRYAFLVYEHPTEIATARRDAEHVFRVVLRLVADRYPNGAGHETVTLGPAVGRWDTAERIRVTLHETDRVGFVRTVAEAYVDPCEVARSRW